LVNNYAGVVPWYYRKTLKCHC